MAGNIAALQPYETQTVKVVRKYKTKRTNKGRTTITYHLELALNTPAGPFDFGEKPTINTVKKRYKKVKKNVTEVEVQLRKGFLDIPIVWKKKILFNSSSKAKPFTVSKDLHQKLKNWKPRIPNFPTPDNYKTSNWPNGQLKEKEPMVGGTIHGVAEYYHPNGQLYSKITYVNGKKHGRYQTFRKDGTQEGDFSMNMGVRHGELRWHDQNGRLKQSAIYDNDKLVHN